MKSEARSAGVSPPKEEIEWEMRPGGMFVQKREVSDDESSNSPMIKISVAHASSHHEVYLPAQSTFCCEQEPTLPLVRSMGQKATKRKRKRKVAEMSSNNIDMTTMLDAVKEKYSIMTKIAEAKKMESMGKSTMLDAVKEKYSIVTKIAEAKKMESMGKLYEILLKDTSGMSEIQRQDHELVCNYIRRKLL